MRRFYFLRVIFWVVYGRWGPGPHAGALPAVPVVLADGALPFQHLFDWSQFALVVPEARVGAVPRLVRAVGDARWRRMRAGPVQAAPAAP